MKKNITILLYSELILSVVLSLLCFVGKFNEEDGLLLNGFLKIVPSLLYGLFLVLLVLEWIIVKKVPFKRGIYLCFTFLIAFMMFQDGKVISLYNVTLWLFSLPLVVILIITIIIFARKELLTNEEVKSLPIGFFSSKQVKEKNITLLIYILSLVIASIIAYQFGLKIFIIVILYAVLIGGAIVFFALLFINPLNKAIKHINNNLSYKDLKNKLEELRKNNLHEESENYLNIVLANYASPFSLDESFKYFELCKEPSLKSYSRIYKIVKINYYINSNNFLEAQKEIDCLKKIKQNKKIVESLEREIIINSSDDIINNIEKFYYLENKIIFSNVTNCFCLMKYFYTRKINEKSLYYAHKLIDYRSDFAYYNNFAQQIIDEIENGVKLHKMNLHNDPFVLIKEGSKTIEMRLNDEKRSLIRIGDKIEFQNNLSKEKMIVKVKNIYHYKTFEELYLHHDKMSLGYKEEEEAKAEDMFAYYSEEKINKYGVLAICISKE